MPVFDGDYQFVEAGKFSPSWVGLDSDLNVEDYKKIAASFGRTMNRVRNLYELPLQLIYWSTVLVEANSLVRHSRGLAPNDDSKDREGGHIDKVNALLSDPQHKFERVCAFAGERLGSMLGDGGRGGIDPARDGAEAALAAMIMESYAALETLVVDAWIASVNNHSVLASNWIEKNPEKQLSGPTIAGYGFKIADRMGTILHETRRVTFESLGDIRKAYKQGFKGEMDDVFEPVPDLVKVEKTRHLFAHRGGLVDRKFKDEMNEHKEYAGLVVGERLRITGPVARDHISACVRCGTSLLKKLDTWALAQA